MPEIDSRHRTFFRHKQTLLLLGMAVLLTAFVLYFQTRHAFNHILVPIVAAALPGELQVQDGSLSLPATVTLTGFSYQQPAAGLSLRVEQLLIRISVMAWLREHRILVEELDLKDGQLQLNSQVSSPIQPGDTAVTTTGQTAAMVPLAIQHARLDNITVSIQREPDDLTARNMMVEINNVGPDRMGTIDLRTEVEFTRAGNQMRWAGELLLTSTLEENHGDRHLKWSVTNTLTVREWLTHVNVSDSGAIRLDQILSGDYDFTQGTAHADSSLTLRQGGTALGALSLTFTRTQSANGPVMDLGLKLQEVTDEALNLLLRTDGPVRLRSTHMSGFVDVHAIGEQYEFRSLLTGQHLQAVSGNGSSPPLDFDLAQTGRVDSRARTVTLDIFELRVAEHDQVRLAGELKYALTIHLGAEGTDGIQVSAQNSPQADWVLTINGIGVAEVRQWGEVFGWNELRGIRGGRLDGTVALSCHDNGDVLDVSTKLILSNVRMMSTDSTAGSAPLKFAHEFHGTVTKLTFLQLQSWIMTASVNGHSAGEFRLSGAIDLSMPTKNIQLVGSLRLEDLPGEACNPLLALWTHVRIDRARFNGTADLKIAGDQLAWEIDLRGDQVRFRLPEMPQTAPPLDLVVAQSGSFSRTTGVLRLNKILLQELKRSRPVITAVLNKPVHFMLPGKETEPKALQALDSLDTNFTIEVRHLGIDQLRPTLALWNVSALDQVKTGIIDGRWVIQGQGSTGTLSIAGNLDVTDLRLDAGAIHTKTPLALRSRIAATLTEFSRIQLEALSINALAGTNLIAEARVTGQTNVADGSTDLAATFNTDNMATLLDRIGLLDERQRKLFTGGTVSVEGRLKGRGPQHPLSTQATIRAREFRFQPMQGQFLTYSLLSQGTAELNTARTGIEFNKIGMTLESQGNAAGTLTLAGAWPIASPEQGGAMTVETKDLDAAPIANLFGLLPGREQGPLLLNADVAITRDSASGMLTVRGQEILGPIRLALSAKNEGPNEATLHLRHDLSRHDDEIRATTLTMTAERPGGKSDRVTASGSVKIAGQPDAHLKGEIASLDVDWYAALLSNPKPTPETDTNQAAVKTRTSRPKESNTRAFLTNLDAELSIGSLSYHALRIGPGRVIVKGTGTQMEVKLEQTGIAEGRMEAILTLAQQNNQAQLTWSGNGEGLHIGTLLQAIEPGQESRLQGIGSFSTSGTGLLNQDPFRKHLTGIINFNIADGRFMRVPILEFLSRYTHIKELDQMGFDDLRGKVRLENQWMHVESMKVTGTLASLNGNVSVSPDNTVDGRVFAKIGPSIGSKIKIPCISALLQTSDGFTALPFAVLIKGSTEHLAFSADTAAWNYVTGGITSIADTMKNLLRGCREDRSEDGAQ